MEIRSGLSDHLCLLRALMSILSTPDSANWQNSSGFKNCLSLSWKLKIHTIVEQWCQSFHACMCTYQSFSSRLLLLNLLWARKRREQWVEGLEWLRVLQPLALCSCRLLKQPWTSCSVWAKCQIFYRLICSFAFPDVLWFVCFEMHTAYKWNEKCK